MSTNVNDRYCTISCECGKCHRRQVIKIGEWIAGQTQCRLGRLGQAPCGGRLEYQTTEREEAIGNAISLLHFLSNHSYLSSSTPLGQLLDIIENDVSCWSEQQATPQEMGWVGSNGLP